MIKQMRKNILKVLLFTFIMWAVGFACYNAGKSAVYSNHNEYYVKTEALLDSICGTYEDSFRDTIMETGTYYEYEVARENYTK